VEYGKEGRKEGSKEARRKVGKKAQLANTIAQTIQRITISIPSATDIFHEYSKSHPPFMAAWRLPSITLLVTKLRRRNVKKKKAQS